jgi:hypothetical protein
MVQKMTPTDSVPIWWYNALAIFDLWSPHLTHRGNTAAKGIHQPTHRTTRTLQYDRHIFVCCAASCHLIQSSIYFSFQLLSTKDCKFWVPWYRVHGDLHVSVSIKKALVLMLLDRCCGLFCPLVMFWCTQTPTPQSFTRACCTSLSILLYLSRDLDLSTVCCMWV